MPNPLRVVPLPLLAACQPVDSVSDSGLAEIEKAYVDFVHALANAD